MFDLILKLHIDSAWQNIDIAVNCLEFLHQLLD
jgi:hypothetical protein